jgi:hypothetical protein
MELVVVVVVVVVAAAAAAAAQKYEEWHEHRLCIHICTHTHIIIYRNMWFSVPWDTETQGTLRYAVTDLNGLLLENIHYIAQQVENS